MRRGAVACGPATSQYGEPSLAAAARRGHTDTVELLLDRGADLEAKDRVSAAAVCCCATGRAGRHGRVGGAAMARMRRGVLPSRANSESGLAEWDFSKGAMVRRGALTSGSAASQDGSTALVTAAWRGHKDTVELLLDRDADLEAKDRVSAAVVCCCATGRAGRQGRMGGAAMAVMRCGVVLLSRAGVGGGAGGVGYRQGSDVATRCGDMRACDVAAWCYGPC